MAAIPFDRLCQLRDKPDRIVKIARVIGGRIHCIARVLFSHIDPLSVLVAALFPDMRPAFPEIVHHSTMPIPYLFVPTRIFSPTNHAGRSDDLQ